VQLYHFRGGYAGVVRIDPDTINVAFTIDRSSLRDPISFQALRKGYLEQNSRMRDLLCHSESCGKLRSTWPIYLPPRKRYGRGFALVGDAAQVTEPVSGEGIYFALKSGQLAARSIAEALRDTRFADVVLTSYESAYNDELGTRVRLNTGLRLLMNRPVLLGAAVFLLERRKDWLQAVLRQICGGTCQSATA
jgi:flavin-dependent dehydrogenase